MSAAPINLREERLRRGKSLDEMAAEIGVTADVLGWAERTGRSPHPKNALKIADFYGFDVLEQWPIAAKDAA